MVFYLGLAGVSASFTTLNAPLYYRVKRKITILRVLGSLFAMILLLALSSPATSPVKSASTFPGRAPAPLAGKQTALVLQASCFTRQPYMDESCRIDTDRRRFGFISDFHVVILLILTLMFYLARMGDLQEYFEDCDEANDDTVLLNNKKVRYGRFLFEMYTVILSCLTCGISYWQFWDLRRYMNHSGWLSNQSQIAVDSFTELVPIFEVMSVFLLLAALFDERDTSRLVDQDKSKQSAAGGA
ncbi:MAG: hypothetical protein M1820_005380 [Bogoriella megaspora]|nr:MAG: hypothetical protein M1820_005380 [Bogoriella megaspora]